MSQIAVTYENVLNMVTELTEAETADLVMTLARLAFLQDRAAAQAAFGEYWNLANSRIKISPFIQELKVDAERARQAREQDITEALAMLEQERNEIRKLKAIVEKGREDFESQKLGLHNRRDFIGQILARIDSHEIESGVYILRSGDLYKIGKSSRVKNRVANHAHSNPQLEVICVIPAVEYAQLEADLHKLFSGKRVQGEWFRLSDYDIAELTAMQPKITE